MSRNLLTRNYFLCIFLSFWKFSSLFICQLLIKSINFSNGYVSFFVWVDRVFDSLWSKQSYWVVVEWELRWKYFWYSVQREYVWRTMFVLGIIAIIEYWWGNIFIIWWVLWKWVNCSHSNRLNSYRTSTLQMLSYQLSEKILWVFQKWAKVYQKVHLHRLS